MQWFSRYLDISISGVGGWVDLDDPVGRGYILNLVDLMVLIKSLEIRGCPAIIMFFWGEHHFADTIYPQIKVHNSKTLLHIYRSVPVIH